MGHSPFTEGGEHLEISTVLPGFTCNACSKCSAFHSCFTGACGQPAYAHDMTLSKKDWLKENQQDGVFLIQHGRVNQLQLPGRRPHAVRWQRIWCTFSWIYTLRLWPFLKVFQAPSRSSSQTLIDVGTSSPVSLVKRSEEDDIAFFERWYQERIKMEKAAKCKGKAPLPSNTKLSWDWEIK